MSKIVIRLSDSQRKLKDKRVKYAFGQAFGTEPLKIIREGRYVVIATDQFLSRIRLKAFKKALGSTGKCVYDEENSSAVFCF